MSINNFSNIGEYSNFIHEWEKVTKNILEILTKNNISIALVPEDVDDYNKNLYKTEWRKNRENDRNS